VRTITSLRVLPDHVARMRAILGVNDVTQPPLCIERFRLLQQYAEAVRQFRDLAAAVSETAISYELDAFFRAWDQCEQGRRRCADLRHAIADHISHHGCST
jgi:hypothetical protein